QADAPRALRQGDDPALLPGPRLPQGLADPRDDLRSERRPAGMGVRAGQAAQGNDEGDDRLVQAPSLAARPAVGGRRARARRPAALPGTARPALPELRGLKRHARHTPPRSPSEADLLDIAVQIRLTPGGEA